MSKKKYSPEKNKKQLLKSFSSIEENVQQMLERINEMEDRIVRVEYSTEEAFFFIDRESTGYTM